MFKDKMSTYAAVAFVNTLGWGVYYSFTRRYLVDELSAGRVVMLLAGLEWGMSMASLFAAILEQRLGRKSILIGSLSSLPIVASSFIKEPYAFSAVISFSSLLWALSWPSVISTVFQNVTGEYGKTYSSFTVATGLGFGVGALLSGLVYKIGGAFLVFLLIALLFATTFVAGWALSPAERANRNSRVEWRLRSGGLTAFLTSLTLIVFAREMFFAVGAVKLSTSIDELFPQVDEGTRYVLYGLFYGFIGSLISPFARLVSGRVVDRYGPLNVYIASGASYLVTYWLFALTSGIVPVLLWLVPLYPFLDTSVYSYVAERSGVNNRTHGFGQVIFFTSLGGILLLPAQPLVGSNTLRAGCFITAAALSSMLIAYSKSRS